MARDLSEREVTDPLARFVDEVAYQAQRQRVQTNVSQELNALLDRVQHT